VGLPEPISRVQNRGQLQQLIVWRTLEPRSQLIKVLAARHANEQAPWGITQQAI
jgi:hypothetical protein